MYLFIEFDYFALDKVDDAGYAELRAVIPTIPDTKPEYSISGSHLINDDAIPVLAKYQIKFRVSEDAPSQGVGAMLVKLQDRIKALGYRCDDLAELVQKQCAVQIAIPDLGLLQITEVAHLDNCCTDYLQSYLNEGWRILAVCPPNAQRRPDYIIGRSKVPV